MTEDLLKSCEGSTAFQPSACEGMAHLVGVERLQSYVIGSPALSRATLHLSSGRTFTMRADNMSDENVYVQSVRLNGKAWNSFLLPCDAVVRGGKLEFTMDPHPNPGWGANTAASR